MFNGITSATFDGVLGSIKELIPVVIPAVDGFLAFRKGCLSLKVKLEKLSLRLDLKSNLLL